MAVNSSKWADHARDAIGILLVIGMWSLVLYYTITLFEKSNIPYCEENHIMNIIDSARCLTLPKSIKCNDRKTISYITGNWFVVECVTVNITLHNGTYETDCLNLCITPINGTILVDTVNITKVKYDKKAEFGAYVCLLIVLLGAFIGLILGGMIVGDKIDKLIKYIRKT